MQDFHLEAKLFSHSADCILVSRKAHLTIQDDTFQGDANGSDFQPSLGGASCHSPVHKALVILNLCARQKSDAEIPLLKIHKCYESLSVSAVNVFVFTGSYKLPPFNISEIFFFFSIHSSFLFISGSHSFFPHSLLLKCFLCFSFYKFSTYYLYKIQPLGSFFPHAGSCGSTVGQMLARSLQFLSALLTLATTRGGSLIHSY